MGDDAEVLNEARDLVHEASAAIDALMGMLSGAEAVNQEGLFYLLRPLADNLQQAEERLDLMRH